MSTLPVNPGAGLFTLGERVEWGGSAAGVARTFSGAIVEVVPAGTRPQKQRRIPAADRREAAGRRDHESYIVRCANGRHYWPRVSSLGRAPELKQATDADREMLRNLEQVAGIIRDRAVENVDRRHGYTMEFAPSPVQHRLEYDEEEARLRAEPFEALIERSSLGTPEAKAIRARTSPDVARRIVERAAELDEDTET